MVVYSRVVTVVSYRIEQQPCDNHTSNFIMTPMRYLPVHLLPPVACGMYNIYIYSLVSLKYTGQGGHLSNIIIKPYVANVVGVTLSLFKCN